MKKLNLIIFLLIVFNVYAHDQTDYHIHQHIVREAFKLLLLSYPELQNSELAIYIGNDETNSTSMYHSWGDGTVVSGSWIEDEYDIVYHYGIWSAPEFNQTLTPELVQLFLSPETIRQSFVSITHFWDSDGGLNKTTDLSDYASGVYWSYSCENAMQKMLKYFNGDFQNRCLSKNGNWWQGCSYVTTATDFSMQKFIDLYKQYGIIQIQATQYLGLTQWNPTNCPDLYVHKKWIFEMLGRMCHLLADMSVPAHVHCNSHAAKSGMYYDVYEKNVQNYHLWTATEIFAQGKTYLNPYQGWDSPLYYLMYYLNQITDHYASGKTNGDDDYDTTCPGLTEIIPTLGLPTSTTQINQSNLSSMHDVIFPLAIRATAGMLFWFATQTGMLRVQAPVSVNKVFEFDQTEVQTQMGYIAEPMNISVPSTISKNGNTYYFAGWSDDNYAPNPRTITPSSNFSFYALYKTLQKSNNSNAYSVSGQRKFVQTTDGWQHKVYESTLNGVSHIFYEIKSPTGDWQFVKFHPATLYADEGGGNSPAIDCDNTNYGERVFISFKQGNSIQVLCYAYFTDAGTYAYNGQCNYYVGTSFNSQNIACGGDGNFMIVYTTSNGINYKVGTSVVDVNGHWNGISFTNCEGLISGTNAYSSTPAISGMKDNYGAEVFNIAWSQTIPPPPIPPSVLVKTCQLLLYFNYPNNQYDVYQYPETPITVSSSSMRYNSHISIVSLPETVGSDMTINSRIAWAADYSGTGDPWQTKTVMCDPWQSTIRHNVYYHHTRSVSINKLNNSLNFYFAWSQVYNTPGWTDYNWFVNGTDLKHFSSVSTRGWDLHLSNGNSGSNLFVSSFYPKTLPYYFQNSNSLESSDLGKIGSMLSISENRGVVFENSGAGICYSLGNIIVDNNSIKFIQVDSVGSNICDLTDVLLSEPILLGNESMFLFNETVLISDSLAAIQLLSDSSSITFNIELIDNNDNILGLIKNTVVNANQLQSLNTSSYYINIVGLEGMTVRMRVSIVTDIEDPVFTVMQEYTEESILSKLKSQELIIKGLEVPITYSLEQNYPNPFNPSTTIRYQIPQDGIVTLKIYDILGAEVATLVNEQKIAGRYEVNFNASTLASGVYIYKIQSGKFVASRKMILIK